MIKVLWSTIISHRPGQPSLSGVLISPTAPKAVWCIEVDSYFFEQVFIENNTQVTIHCFILTGAGVLWIETKKNIEYFTHNKNV